MRKRAVGVGAEAVLELLAADGQRVALHGLVLPRGLPQPCSAVERSRVSSPKLSGRTLGSRDERGGSDRY